MNNDEEIFNAVEPLVDGITNLIYSAYSKDLLQMKESSEVIADQTMKLVNIVNERVLKINDQILVNDMVDSIKSVSKKIAALRLAYNNVVQSNEKQQKQAFAVAAKEVGDSLRQLMYTMDTSYAKRIQEAVKKARPLVKNVGTAARTSKDSLLENAKNFATANILVIQAGEDASKATLDQEKRVIFLECCNDIKKYSTDLIMSCKNLSDRPNSEEVLDKVLNLEQSLLASYYKLEQTSKILKELAMFGRIGATISELDDLLGRLENLKQTSDRCYKAIGSNDYLNEAREVTQQVVALFKEAQKVLDKTEDPVMRNKLQHLMSELKTKASEFVKASKEKHTNPNISSQRVDFAKGDLDETIDLLYSLFDPHTKRGLNQQVIYGTEVILMLADKVIDSSRNGDQQNYPTYTKDLLLCADQVVLDTETLGKQTENVQMSKKIVGIAREVRVLCTQLIETSNNASNFSAKQKQDTLRSNLEKKLLELRNVASEWTKYEEEYERKKEEERRRKEEEERKLRGDSPLVKAAKEEANNANLLAREAEKFAQLLTDPQQKQKILAGAQKLKALGEDLVDVAIKYDQDPNNNNLEMKYHQAQKNLTDGIGYIVKLTNNRSLLDSFGGLEELLLGSGKGLRIAEELMKFIDEVNLKMKKDPNFTVEGAKLITEKTKELATVLRLMAKEETEPKFKEQFSTFANGLNDKALQIKILSAVNLAEGGSKNSNQVTSASTVLRGNLVDLISSLHSAALQSSIRQTNKQAEAIKRLAEAFRNQSK